MAKTNKITKTKKQKEKTTELNINNINLSWIKIDPKIPMATLIMQYPELAETLTYDYGLHCVNCMISELDTLEGGAIIHGIEGNDLKEMIKDLENIINGIVED